MGNARKRFIRGTALPSVGNPRKRYRFVIAASGASASWRKPRRRVECWSVGREKRPNPILQHSNTPQFHVVFTPCHVKSPPLHLWISLAASRRAARGRRRPGALSAVWGARRHFAVARFRAEFKRLGDDGQFPAGFTTSGSGRPSPVPGGLRDPGRVGTRGHGHRLSRVFVEAKSDGGPEDLEADRSCRAAAIQTRVSCCRRVEPPQPGLAVRASFGRRNLVLFDGVGGRGRISSVRPIGHGRR